MPIYEYRCDACGLAQARLLLGSERHTPQTCERCGSADLTKLPSRVAFHRSEADRLDDFDTSKMPDESFYRDSRNVGLWAKKRAKELGVDLGPQFEETLEKARTGKILDEE